METTWADELKKKFTPQKISSDFSLSIIIPTFNCSDLLLHTLESIKNQTIVPEIIIVDAGSKDHTLSIARSFHPFVHRIYSVADFHLFEMLNRGISLKKGNYVTFLNPGSIYLSSLTLAHIAESAAIHHNPELIFCGSQSIEEGRSPRLIHSPFEKKLLKRGVQPMTLSACFFHTDLFDKIGKFNPKIEERSAFDFLCRFSSHKELKYIMLDRIYIEEMRNTFSFSTFLRYTFDTWRILDNHFGLWKACGWFLGISHLQMIKWGIKDFRTRLSKI